MAASISIEKKVKPNFSQGVAEAGSLISADQAEALKDNPNEFFKLVGVTISAFHGAELTPEQEAEKAEAEKALADLADSLTRTINAIRVDYLKKGVELTEGLDGADQGIALADLDVQKAEAFAKAEADQQEKVAVQQEKIDTLATIQSASAWEALTEHVKYTGTRAKASASVPIKGSRWLVIDLLTRSRDNPGAEKLRCQFYLDQQGGLYAYPVGEDWFKKLARPFALAEAEWTKLADLDQEKLKSASLLQALCYRAITHARVYKSAEKWGAGLAGVLANDNVDQSSTGGSRNVHHVVDQHNEKGYTRQLWGEKLTPYKLPQSEAEAE